MGNGQVWLLDEPCCRAAFLSAEESLAVSSNVDDTIHGGEERLSDWDVSRREGVELRLSESEAREKKLDEARS